MFKRVILLAVCMAIALTCCMVYTAATAQQAETSAVLETKETISETVSDFSLSATDYVAQIKAGWNLGNTMEANGRWNEKWTDRYKVKDVETGWGNPVTTQAMFDLVAKSGFNAVRIPITWYRWVDDANGYKIKPEFMARIKEIVGYAYKNNQFVIINMHHDDCIRDKQDQWLDITAKGDKWEKIKEKYAAIWTQIADEFKDYDDHLIFEAANEVIAMNDWWGQQDYYFDNLNEIFDIFVNIVRNSGGNNAKRYIMLPTYGSQWYPHQFEKLVIPNNDEHCIVDIHYYNTSCSLSTYESVMKPVYEGLVAKGIPVVIGESGTKLSESWQLKNNWVATYYKTAYKYKIPIFIWDDGGSMSVMNRITYDWYTPQMIDAINKIVNGEEVELAEIPTAPPTTKTKLNEIIKNTGDYKAGNDVYYKWNINEFCQSEGWQTDAKNKKQVAYEQDENGIRIKDDGFASQQINTMWMLSKNVAKKALEKAKNTTNYLLLKITLNSAKNGNGEDCNVFVKHDVTGKFTIPEDLEIKPGETVELLIDTSLVESPAGEFTLQIQQFEEVLTAIDISFSNINVAVPAKSPEKGDVNGDSEINSKDSLLLRRFIADFEITEEFYAEVADLNGDGKVNSKDSLILRRFNADIIKSL